MSSSENILYELLNTVEWIVPQTSEEIIGSGVGKPPVPVVSKVLGVAQRLLSLVSPLASKLTSQISDVLGCQSTWKVSYCSAGGGVVAVLQEAALEIRHAKHHFQDVIGYTDAVHPDAYPQWRRVAWAASGSVVAVSFSDGVVQLFSTLAQHLYTIYPPRYTEGAMHSEPQRAIAALSINEEKLQGPKWLCEVLCVEYNGSVRSYLVSAAEGYQTYATFSLAPYYPHGITAATLHSSLLVVAGATPYMSDPSLNYYGVGHGITLWRRLEQYPHLKQVSSLPDDSYEPPSASLFRRLYSKLVHPATPLTCAFCVRVSPCGKHLAALHLSGAVSVWHFPSLRKSKYWLLKDQPDAEVVNPSAASTLKLLCQHSPKKKELKSEFPVALEWWCRHDPTIGDSTASLDDGLVLVRSCGSLTVSSSTTLTNLLGDHPEYLAPHPMVCAPEGAQFLCLELERSLARRQRTTTGTFAHPLTQALTGEYPEWSLEEEAMLDERTMQEGSDGAKESEEEEIGYLAWMLLLFWQLLYWLTNDVRFLVWRGHVVSERYRLVQLQSSSPEQLYYNKIKAEEYGEALLLAQTYELESDLVYQSQWERSVPSMESISDYLSKVRCRAWVLHQCCAVVPAHLNPARELLLFGLRGTGLTVLINISSGEDCGEWLSELTLYDCEDVEQRQQVLLQEEQLSKQVTWQELTEAQLELIKIRYRLLRYLDRLLTYELLVGGGHLAPERYDAAAYSRLREQSSVAACRQFARDGDGDAVAVMWTHHGQATLPHRLALLSNFPPTLGPFEYRALLPACGVDGEVLQWQQGPLRDVDWCERHVSGIGDPDDSVEDVCGLYEAVKGVQGVPDGEPQLTAQMVSRWYQERARQLERECGLVDSALDLLKLGRERNVPGLEPLLQLLTSLEVLVYEAGYTHMSLDELSDMPSSHVLALMLDKSDGSNLLQRLREWVLPFLGRCEAAQAGARDALLSQYLCTLSRSNLAAVSNILKFATSSRQLLQEDALHTCAVECIYEIKAYDQLSVASVILDGLPRAADESVRESLQLLEVQLWGCELMHKRDVSVLPCDLRRMAAADAHQLYTKLAHAALKRSPPLSLKEWQSLLDDMLELQLKLLTSTEPGHCYTSVAEALLTSRQSEYINFGSSFLSLSPSPRDAARGRNPYLEGVSHHEAVHLVLNAARGYFNTAERYGDPALQFAKQCLDRLAEVQEKKLQEAVQVERDLMAALEILHEFGVDQLPLQVRLCSDRESIVKGAIERSPGACLQYWWRVLQLGQLLRLEGSVARRETTVLVMLATQAFKMDDVDACSSLCEKLMTLGEQESWQICSELAQHPRLIDLSAKTKLTNYALTYCPREQLPALLNLRHSVELEVVYEVAKSTIVREDLDRAEDVFLDAIESPIKDEEGAGNTIGSIVHEGRLLEATLGATHTVSAKATSLLGALGKASFWTSALSLVIPLRERAQDQSDDQEDNLDFTCQGCHAFYFDCCNLAHCSNIGYRYSDYSNPSLSNLSLRFSMALLKASLLEQIIAAGCGVVPSDVPNTKQDTTEKVVQELARSVLPQDTVFGLSLLFQLHPLQLAHDVLIALPTTDITIQVCQYYYALQIYSRLHPWTQPRLAPQYQHDPSVVIACAALVALKYKEVYNRRSAIFSSEKSKAAASAKLLPDDINKLEVDGIKIFTGVHEVDEKLTKLYEYFCSSEELLDDYVQGEALHRLDAGVDTVRFLNDPRYKEDTVLGLCMTTDPKMLDLAIVLAKKYKVSLWEVHMTQLQYMLSSDLATHQIAENMKARNAMHELKTKPELFVETLQAKVLTLIDGTDHKRLVLFFSLIREAAEQSEVASLVAMKATAEKHIDVLEQLMKLAPSLSYHHLLTRQMDTLSHLGTVVSDSNIKPLAALLLRVPSAAALVTCSSLYCAYAIKRFFTGAKEAKTTIAERQWVQRYEESVSLNWHELSAEDVLVLARALLLSEEAFQLVPLRARVSIAQIILDRARASNKQDDEHQQDWSATVTELNAWVTHLKSLHSPAFTALISGPDLALRHYAKMYATSDGSSAAATTVCNKALLGGCDLAVLRELREVMPEHAAPQPEDTLHSLIQRSLDALTEQGQQSDLLLPELLQCSSKNEQHTWWVERVQHLCSVLSCELQQENDLLMEELLMESARETALCENVALHHRLALFRAFFENLPASEEDKDLMLYLETRDVLACVDFPVTFASSTPTTPTVAAAGKEGDDSASSRVVEIGVSSVSTSEGRKELLEALMEAGNSPQRTRALLRLLQLWPSFSQEVYDSLTDNPWEILLTRLVGECDATGYGLPVNVIWETVNTALAKQQLPTSSLGHISLELLGVGMTAWPLAAKVALAKHNPRAIDAVLQNYSIAAHQVCSSDYDDEILQGFINRGLVPRLVGTPLYEPCTQYLIRTGDSNVVQGVLQQLQLSHPSHATALSQRVAVARPALTSITSAFKKVYSRLL